MSDKPLGAEKKISPGLCGTFLGWLGIHKFIFGYKRQGNIQLIFSVACGAGSIIGLMKRIIYLIKRGWFYQQLN